MYHYGYVLLVNLNLRHACKSQSVRNKNRAFLQMFRPNINFSCKFCVFFADDYFNSRMPILMKRIAQGGVRLAMILNHVFGDSNEGFTTPTKPTNNNT